jgi:hopanoid biosynthesis associated protein HpnK
MAGPEIRTRPGKASDGHVSKRLIVTADDFGLTEGVNKGIVLAHREGIVTGASLMVNGAAFDSAVDMLRLNPDLDIGLHLNLTQGFPTSMPAAVPSLANSSGFLYHDPFDLLLASFRAGVRSEDLEREIRAQLEKAFQAGLRITHIDGHKHVHLIPRVLRTILKVMPSYGIGALRGIIERTPRIGSFLVRNKSAWPWILKQYLLGKSASIVWILSRRRISGPEFVFPRYFYGITQTGFLDRNAIADILGDLRNTVSELMCHPGYLDNELKNTPTRLRMQRERELELLTGSEVRKLVEQKGIKLVSYQDLVECNGQMSSTAVEQNIPLQKP